jgi:hypothetical protein
MQNKYAGRGPASNLKEKHLVKIDCSPPYICRQGRKFTSKEQFLRGLHTKPPFTSQNKLEISQNNIPF